MRRRGVYTEINLGHAFLTEALHVIAPGTDDPCWIVHKTPDDAVAVRLWPGLADIVPTVDDALAVIARAIDPPARAGRAQSGAPSPSGGV
jgi:hypothetical protein